MGQSVSAIAQALPNVEEGEQQQRQQQPVVRPVIRPIAIPVAGPVAGPDVAGPDVAGRVARPVVELDVDRPPFNNELKNLFVEKELINILSRFHVKNAISIGLSHGLALVDGKVFAWGKYDNRHIPETVRKQEGQVMMISACVNGDHSMALLPGGVVECWGGSEDFGQCVVPKDIQGQVAMISAGKMFSVALLIDGSIRAWGRIYVPRSKGVDDYKLTVPITAPNFGKRAVMISAGRDHVIVLFIDGSIGCFGNNDSGQCDVPKYEGSVIKISACDRASGAVLDTGKVLCWGLCDPPVKINATGKRVTSISMGRGPSYDRGPPDHYYGIAVFEDMTAMRWGTQRSFVFPSWIQGQVADVSTSYNGVTFLLTNGKVVCCNTLWREERLICNVPPEILGTAAARTGGYYPVYFHHCY